MEFRGAVEGHGDQALRESHESELESEGRVAEDLQRTKDTRSGRRIGYRLVLVRRNRRRALLWLGGGSWISCGLLGGDSEEGRSWWTCSLVEPPAFKLLVRVDNGRIFGLRNGGGGDVLVSYAGVPLARGRAPAFCVETKKAVTVAVDATSAGVGVPEELFQLMSEERRRSGVAQLEIDLWLDYGLFTCRVELGGEQRASECEEQNFIYSS
ncbi:hypothetical protein C2845_PM10G18950 [Panicum miliaceum]|uniref:Uncharacterized protein n=1 Tax=Panicum miliaceum TaxID=4540 RepID=A0A3L6PFB9_PANMI|nr:hypothetical protein C2845_PM10G18950 [Panicum miliaceum]